MSFLRQMLKFTMTAALPRSFLMTSGSGGTDRREIALTFDDGPHPEHTPRLLDLLDHAGIKATFFIIGEQAQQHPDLIHRMVWSGHELGNHTWSHSEPSNTSAEQFLSEVRRTREWIRDVAGRDCVLVRPPKGKLSLAKTIGLWREWQTIVLWNVDPKDFAMRDDLAMQQWGDRYLPREGDIVLFHDNHSRSAIAVPRLANLTNQGWQFVTISDWLRPTDHRAPAVPFETESPTNELHLAGGIPCETT